METFEVIRVIPESEKLVTMPIPPMPTCQGSATEEDWDEYWLKRDNYYHGIQLKKGN